MKKFVNLILLFALAGSTLAKNIAENKAKQVAKNAFYEFSGIE